MSPIDLERAIGVLHVEIDGAWAAKSFAKLLGDLHDTYRRLNTLDFFDRAIRTEKRENENHYKNEQYDRASHQFSGLFYGSSRHYREFLIEAIRPTFDVLATVAEQYDGEPLIHCVSYSSPGWIEILANLNPLKVIADMIAEWRKQNTEREKLRLDYDVKTMEIRAGILSTVFSNELLLKADDPRIFEMVSENVLKPAHEFVTGAARDSRIISVKALSPAEAAEITRRSNTGE